MDRNTTIGFLLLGLLLIGYMVYNQRGQKEYQAAQKARRDSIARVSQQKADAVRAKTAALDTAVQQRYDSLQRSSQLGVFAAAGTGATQTLTVENALVQITFSSLGGRPEKVILKQYKAYDGSPLDLMNSHYDQLGLLFYTAANQPVRTNNLQFRLMENTLGADSTRTIAYRLEAGDAAHYLEYRYVLHPGQYMLDFNVKMVGLENVLRPTDKTLSLIWNGQANQQEPDAKVEKNNTQIYYRLQNGEHDYFSLIRTTDKELTEPVQWVSFKQHFFNTSLVADKSFDNLDIKGKLAGDSSAYIAQADFRMQIPYTPAAEFEFPMHIYYGPNDYYILKSYHRDLEEVIPLGYGLYTFAKYINKWLLLPVFLFLGKIFGSWGITIIFLTIVIRLLISPLTYKSYLSQAKMKVLKPELDALKEKYKDDQQKFGMEQMKLFRSTGVSPLGGCLPMVLQIPIFFSLYMLFQSTIEVRQQSFLWVKDLSIYDAVLHLPFRIPLYGDHVSLLTLLMTLTSLFMAFYNKNMTGMGGAGQDNPALKYMPYIMPVFFLGFFNSMAAALTLYYLISNLITIAIQWVIQTYIIDEDKIHRQIQENKKKGPQKSKWMQRLEQAQQQKQTLTQQRKK
ncbi:membrane protein insertase YidC [Compostibacter hankyongensis]|uniref:Membrane protein insertase YidC n=1 Tax=Compostibacter hankyongensis TaxID=1007089 RepID=A0ABP8FXJ8_9BACT